MNCEKVGRKLDMVNRLVTALGTVAESAMQKSDSEAKKKKFVESENREFKTNAEITKHV